MKVIAQRILAARRILISTHEDPDGDGIGAMMALAIALERIGISVDPILPDPCPDRFQFLDPEGWLRILGPNADRHECEADLALVVDTHRWQQLGRLGELIRASGTPTLFLDHHPVAGALRPDVDCDASASSTGEMVYRLIRSYLDLPIDARVGECLYTAIAYDTHSFRFIRNNPSPHLVAADLLSRGVDAGRVYRHIFGSNPVGKMRLVGEILSTLRLEEQGRLAWVELRHERILEHQARLDDLRDAVNYLIEIDGVEVAVLLKETESMEIKVSLRSKGRIEVRGIAQNLGGGGHPFAAGATLAPPIEDAARLVHDLVIPLMRSAAAVERDGAGALRS